MDYINDYSDDRNKAWCIHCSTILSDAKTSKDHVPSKSLLELPYPSDLPTTTICSACNNEFAADEEYFRVFIECVLTGSTDPKEHKNPRIERALERNSVLKSKIESAKEFSDSVSGQNRIFWKPDAAAIKKVILKNARGHALYELGEPMLDEPVHVWFQPLAHLAEQERFSFENPEGSFWPEVGSRMMTRMMTGQDMSGPWIDVQDEVYRYTVTQAGGLTVRTVLYEYLATEVVWE